MELNQRQKCQSSRPNKKSDGERNWKFSKKSLKYLVVPASPPLPPGVRQYGANDKMDTRSTHIYSNALCRQQVDWVKKRISQKGKEL